MSKKLFDNSDSESEKEIISGFHTNEDYAKSYNKFRQKELLKKLKDRGLDASDSSETSSSDSETSESEDDVYNPKFDEEFFKTLSSLKSKDPIIYDKNLKFFEDFEDVTKDKNFKRKEKALTLKDYERKVILEKGGVYEDDEEENQAVERSISPSYAEEQEQIRKELKNVLNENDQAEDEEFGGIFKRRNKTKEEEEKEEDDFKKWLAGKKEDIDENKKQKLNPLKQYWDNPNLSKGEKFLRDYVLNNGYINKATESVPTYEEIIGEENLSDDEKELEKQSEFEQKFNFRFEEPDKEFIKRFPRTIEDSVRQTDGKRRLKRLEVKERKKKEKEQKYKEIEVLKELKKKEIEEKIQKLKEVTGNEELPFDDNDLEEDFNPEEYDKRMKQIFNDEYYQVEEGEEKPECPDIEDLKVEDWDNFDPTKDDDNCNEYEPHCEDDDFIMDCDYEQNCKETFQNELIENTKDKKRRRKRRNRFMEMIKAEKPVFNPEDEKTYAEYIDEYYKMDCEDIIDDIPCRFKYVETVPNDFGLTIEEILLAKNKELNQWASLKKSVQIRPEYVEQNEAKIYKLKSQNLKLKKKIFRSLYGSSSEDEDEDKKNLDQEGNGKRGIKIQNTASSSGDNLMRKEENQNKQTNNKLKVVENCEKDEMETKTRSEQLNETQEKNKKKERKKNEIIKNGKEMTSLKNRKKVNNLDGSMQKVIKSTKNKFSMKSNSKTNLSEERLKAYGLNPRKFYKKQKFLKQKFSNKKS